MSPPLVSCDLYSRFISYSQIYDYYLISPHSNLRYPQISTQVNESILIYRFKGIYIQRHLSENSCLRGLYPPIRGTIKTLKFSRKYLAI